MFTADFVPGFSLVYEDTLALCLLMLPWMAFAEVVDPRSWIYTIRYIFVISYHDQVEIFEAKNLQTVRRVRYLYVVVIGLTVI